MRAYENLNNTKPLIAGCGKNGVNCAKEGLRWRTADQCVQVSDCTCASKSGGIVKVHKTTLLELHCTLMIISQPNSLNEEGQCEKCECHGNEFKCEENCPDEMKQMCEDWSQWFNDNTLQNANTEKEFKSTADLKQMGFCTQVVRNHSLAGYSRRGHYMKHFTGPNNSYRMCNCHK
jgi:hypothetical protein